MPELKQNRRYTVGGGKWAGLTFADEAARLAYAPIATGKGVIAYQEDTGEYWEIESVTVNAPPTPNAANWRLALSSIASEASASEKLAQPFSIYASVLAGTGTSVPVLAPQDYDYRILAAWIQLTTVQTAAGANLGEDPGSGVVALPVSWSDLTGSAVTGADGQLAPDTSPPASSPLISAGSLLTIERNDDNSAFDLIILARREG